MNSLPEPANGSGSGSLPSDGHAMPPAPRLPVPPTADEFADAPAAPRKKVSAGLVWRAFRRHWWQVLVLWTVSSAALVTLVYYAVKPTYDAVAQVRVEPGEQSLYANKNTTPIEFAEFKETQVASVTSPIVLSLALTEHPNLFQLPLLQRAEDAEAEIRRTLKVGIVPKTSFIQLAMSSQSPIEAAEIVNAVLEAYLKTASNTSNEDTERRIKQLKEDRDARIKELQTKRDYWRQLSKDFGAANEEGVKDRGSITSEDYREWGNRLSQVEIERYATEAKLQQLRGERLLPTDPQAQAQVEQAVSEAFYTDPRVAQIQRDIDELTHRLDNVKRVSHNRLDPARVRCESMLKAKQGQLKAWWTRLRPRLEQYVLAGGNGRENDRTIAETELQLASLKSQEQALKDKLGQMRILTRDAGGAALQLEFARHDTELAGATLERVEAALNQLEHEARSPIARVRREFPARPSNRPNVNHRTKAMALAPVVALCLSMGLFLVLEMRAGRVADPDELSSRARVPILGVVPPLPALQSSGGLLVRRDEFRMRRQLDEFVQSLDHLRVVLCARPDPWGRDRHCVLITSACGSEGKTTLAAQLAERCVNAGLMTLLIDADLRNPTLSRMFDASANDGLANVLRGEAAAESAMLVVGDAGGFHFLPAGTPRTDPSRILQGDALGNLLAQARESFDMIIVDAPPVLPVPDALTIGRWTDGAVLAVRYDTSRFSLVERAQRRLAHVGVPVIGAVMSGMRTAETSYGGYYAYGGSGATPEAPVADG